MGYHVVVSHQIFIRRCLTLARRAQGETGINPLVGAVLVRDGKVIAEAHHTGFGKPHAERELLEKYVQKIRTEDILYVNLEPCCHTDKKTPPCVPLLLKRGIKKLVFGMYDPNPSVSGKGIEALRKAGVEITGPIVPSECERLNRGYISLQKKKRPWITLHNARALDGRFAKPDGSSLKITDEDQDVWTHRYLRARHDAILAGIGTILADDPQLNVRYIEKAPKNYRVILDAGLRIPLNAKILTPGLSERTIIVKETKETPPSSAADGLRRAGKESNETKEKLEKLSLKGVRIISCHCEKNTFLWDELWKKLAFPDEQFPGISSILVEGGPKTWEIFRRVGLMDEEVTLVGAE